MAGGNGLQASEPVAARKSYRRGFGLCSSYLTVGSNTLAVSQRRRELWLGNEEGICR